MVWSALNFITIGTNAIPVARHFNLMTPSGNLGLMKRPQLLSTTVCYLSMVSQSIEGSGPIWFEMFSRVGQWVMALAVQAQLFKAPSKGWIHLPLKYCYGFKICLPPQKEIRSLVGQKFLVILTRPFFWSKLTFTALKRILVLNLAIIRLEINSIT